MLRVTLAWLHLVALAIGFGAVYSRGRALSERPLTVHDVRRSFIADSWWGVAAVLWLVTGVWRLLAGTEKTPSYYAHNGVVTTQMALFTLPLFPGNLPKITLIQ